MQVTRVRGGERPIVVAPVAQRFWSVWLDRAISSTPYDIEITSPRFTLLPTVFFLIFLCLLFEVNILFQNIS